MQTARKITFAIPFYSGKEYLRRAIESVLGQSNPDWELLVCDDCGPEGDLSSFLSGIVPPERFRYVRNEKNMGMAGNWNRCLDLAKTDLVTLLHSDDELLPDYTAIMLEYATRYPEEAAFFCRTKIIGSRSEPVFSFPDFVKRFLRPSDGESYALCGEEALTRLLRGNFIMCPTLCYRKSVIGERRFNGDWKMVLDLDFTSRLLLDGLTLRGVPEVLYAYRRHTENATAKYTQDLSRFDEERRISDQLAKVAENRGWLSAFHAGDRKTVLKLHVVYRILEDLSKARIRASWAKFRYLLKNFARRKTA